MSRSKLHMMVRKKRRQESYQDIKSKTKCALKKDEDILVWKSWNQIHHTKHFPDCGPGIWVLGSGFWILWLSRSYVRTVIVSRYKLFWILEFPSVQHHFDNLFTTKLLISDIISIISILIAWSSFYANPASFLPLLILHSLFFHTKFLKQSSGRDNDMTAVRKSQRNQLWVPLQTTFDR